MAFVFSMLVLCSRMDQTTTMLGDCLDHCRARGLPRPLPCSWTAKTTTVLGDCSDHCRARGLLRPLLCLGTAPTTDVLEDCPDHCLENGSPRLHVICTHIQLRDIYLDLATRLIPHLPASSGTTSVRCTCRCISYRLDNDWILNFGGNSFLDLGTTCLRHLLPGSGTKWAHFTLR